MNGRARAPASSGVTRRLPHRAVHIHEINGGAERGVMPDFAERIRFPKVTQISQNVSDFAKRSRSRTRELYWRDEISNLHTKIMNTAQRLSEISPPSMLRLSEIERLIRINRIVVPPLSRRRLIMMCEDGTFQTAPRPHSRSPILVTEESFLKWVESLSGRK
jgi:hypothetical protein